MLETTLLAPATPQAATPQVDAFVLLHGITWGGYCVLGDLVGRDARLCYLQGTLEIMSPSQRHEQLKKRIARLLETFAVERNVALYGYGSTTFRHEAKERGLEPDECYCVDRELGDMPDIAIEVALSSGGLDKLEIYAGLGVPEVWFWRHDAFELFVLEGGQYSQATASRLVPGLEFERLAEFVRMPRQHEAVMAFRATLRG